MTSRVLLPVLFCLALALSLLVPAVCADGPPGPPGSAAATFPTLFEVEPRIPISALPCTISNAGSYYVTGDLTGNNGAHGITISANNVTLDLNGFSLIGISTAKSGIYRGESPTYNNIVVQNGTVRDWGESGVDLYYGDNSLVAHLQVFNNASYGIRIRENSVVTDCNVYGNGAHGIYAYKNSSIRNSHVKDNSENGVLALWSVKVDDCMALGNGENGIYGHDSCAITRCTASGNGNNGVEVKDKCAVRDTICDANGYNLGGAGILVTGICNRVIGCTVTANDYGIRVPGARNFIGRNTASDNRLQNYDIGSQNQHGRVVSDFTGQIDGGLPWANIELPQ